jgi:uncharacterized protein YkwD
MTAVAAAPVKGPVEALAPAETNLEGPVEAPEAEPIEIEVSSAGDAMSVAAASELMLRMVNAARRTAGVGELVWSDSAATLAQNQADAMAGGHFGAHYDERGWRPELRWNELGETDYVTENVVYYELRDEAHLTPDLVWEMMEDWVRSSGHFANLIDPQHTSLGFGVAVRRDRGKTYVGAAQAFVTDVADIELLPATAPAGAKLDLRGTLLDDVELAYIGLGRESLPRAMTPAELDATGSPYPIPEVEYSVAKKDVTSSRRGEINATVTLPDIWTDSAVHVSVWVILPDWDYPVCASSQVVLVKR